MTREAAVRGPGAASTKLFHYRKIKSQEGLGSGGETGKGGGKSARQQVDFSIVQESKNVFKENKNVSPKSFSIPIRK